MTFAGKIIHNIEVDAEKLIEGFGYDLENEILPVAISVTNTIKEITDFDTTDIIGSIAGKAGAAAEEKVKATLTKIVPELQLAQSFKSLNDPNAILTAVLKQIGDSTANTKTAAYIELAGMITNDFAKGKLTIADAFAAAQQFYKIKNTPAPVAAPVAPTPAESTTTTV